MLSSEVVVIQLESETWVTIKIVAYKKRIFGLGWNLQVTVVDTVMWPPHFSS